MKRPLVIILAGGEGRRIGGGKPLRTLVGERLVDRAVRLARSWSDEVRVAVRLEGQIPAPGAPLLLDEPMIEGPLAALAAGFAAARSAGREHLLTVPCDVPFLPACFGPELEQAIGASPAALAAAGGRLHPACALWRTDVDLAGYAAAGGRSLLGLAERTGFVAVEWPAETLFNVNRAGDLAEAEARLSEVEDVDHRSGVERGDSGP